MIASPTPMTKSSSTLAPAGTSSPAGAGSPLKPGDPGDAGAASGCLMTSLGVIDVFRRAGGWLSGAARTTLMCVGCEPRPLVPKSPTQLTRRFPGEQRDVPATPCPFCSAPHLAGFVSRVLQPRPDKFDSVLKVIELPQLANNQVSTHNTSARRVPLSFKENRRAHNARIAR